MFGGLKFKIVDFNLSQGIYICVCLICASVILCQEGPCGLPVILSMWQVRKLILNGNWQEVNN